DGSILPVPWGRRAVLWGLLAPVALDVRGGLEVDVGEDGLGPEHHAVVVRVDLDALELLAEVRHVVAQPEEVLLVLAVADLARDLELVALVGDGAAALDGEEVRVRDAVHEDDPAVELVVVRRAVEVLVDGDRLVGAA